MCGITAIISKITTNKLHYLKILIQSLEQLQNRGYDSAGISYFSNNNIIVEKKASTLNKDSIEFLKEKITFKDNINVCIGHTRWATHGSKTDINSHPHMSANQLVTIVHNGIIENYNELKTKYNLKCKSETDTEVISNLIEYFLELNNNIDISIKKTMNLLQGTYGVALLYKKNPNNVYIFRKGSPLILAENNDFIMITSERCGLLNLFTNYINVPSEIVIELNRNNFDFNFTKTSITKINDLNYDLTPHPYLHWTLKEINEQKESIIRATNNGGRIQYNNVILGGIDFLKDKLVNIKNIILLGCGTSLNACMVGNYYLKSIKHFNVIKYIDGSEFSEYDIPSIGQTLVIFCSQSGETKDLHRAINVAKINNCLTMGIINVVNSLIAKEVDCGIYLNAGREVAVASTKSFTSMILVLSLFSLWIKKKLNTNFIFNKNYNDLMNLSNDINSTLKICEKINNNIITQLNKHSLFILGKNKMEAIANEGALKIKEISYIHAEGYNGSSLKHGPFALLSNEFPCILLINNENKSKMLNTYEEIYSRSNNILIITEIIDLIIHDDTKVIIIPENKYYQEVLYIIVLQYIAYLLSVNKNINPDKPKNLAKVVTVE